MRIYSHRGNLSGKTSRENEPGYIMECIEAGFFVEVDLWFKGGEYFLGHDEPSYRIRIEDFDVEQVIFHLKTPHVPSLARADAFAIVDDPFVATLRGWLWTNYGQEPTPQGIVCAPELVADDRPLEDFVAASRGALGICTDHPVRVREILRSCENRGDG